MVCRKQAAGPHQKQTLKERSLKSYFTDAAANSHSVPYIHHFSPWQHPQSQSCETPDQGRPCLTQHAHVMSGHVFELDHSVAADVLSVVLTLRKDLLASGVQVEGVLELGSVRSLDVTQGRARVYDASIT